MKHQERSFGTDLQAASAAREAGQGAAPHPGFGPLRPLDERGIKELGGLMQTTQPLALLWSSARRGALLSLMAAAEKRARIYLLGPADLGDSIAERAWLRDHGARLLPRRGVAAAADLLILNSGGRKTGVFVPPGGYFVMLSAAQAETAFSWFSHLFWFQAREEGSMVRGGCRFRGFRPPRLAAPAPPPGAPLLFCRAALPPAGPSERLIVHEPGASLAGLPPFALGESSGHLDAPARLPGEWSARLVLEPAQALALRRSLSPR